jgi:hypothetical protein
MNNGEDVEEESLLLQPASFMFCMLHESNEPSTRRLTGWDATA